VQVLRRWSEQRLLESIRAGDRRAADRLVQGHYESVYRWLLHLCGQRDLAADLTQETFVQVWQGLDGFRGHASLRTWIHRIACHAYLRSRRTPEPAGTPPPDPAHVPGLEQEALARLSLAQALAQLPPEQRLVTALHYLQGLKTAEIARVLDIPAGTVLSRLHTARARLREFLSSEESTYAQEVRSDVAR
jgi:RNA polymerase sigma-70 factor, ECF subfamily